MKVNFGKYFLTYLSKLAESLAECFEIRSIFDAPSEKRQK